MFPTVAFRLAYDALKRGGDRPAWCACESGTVAGANAEPGRDAGPAGLRLTADGAGLKSDTANVQDRMGAVPIISPATMNAEKRCLISLPPAASTP